MGGTAQYDIRNEDLMNSADEGEIWQSIKSSASRKSPGEDGLPKEFYAKTWNIIRREFSRLINNIMQNPEANPKLMNGIIVRKRTLEIPSKAIGQSLS